MILNLNYGNYGIYSLSWGNAGFISSTVLLNLQASILGCWVERVGTLHEIRLDSKIQFFEFLWGAWSFCVHRRSQSLLGGSWVVISGVISPLITIAILLITTLEYYTIIIIKNPKWC